MISLSIKDIKGFMSHLLIKDTFDDLLLSEATISTANTYTISGSINKSFYSTEELSELPNQDYAYWKSVKPFCFSLIKGNKVPTGMKLIFTLPMDAIETFINNSTEDLLSPEQIGGMFLNINYSGGSATIITGISLKIFTLDKSTEHAYDNYIKQFLASKEIDFEEL